MGGSAPVGQWTVTKHHRCSRGSVPKHHWCSGAVFKNTPVTAVHGAPKCLSVGAVATVADTVQEEEEEEEEEERQYEKSRRDAGTCPMTERLPITGQSPLPL